MRHRVDWQLGSLQPCVRPCWGASLGPWCPRRAGLATGDCYQAALWKPVVSLCQASSNEQLCGLHKIFPPYAFICITTHEPHFFLRLPSGLTSLWRSSGFLLFGCCENHKAIEWLGLEDT